MPNELLTWYLAIKFVSRIRLVKVAFLQLTLSLIKILFGFLKIFAKYAVKN